MAFCLVFQYNEYKHSCSCKQAELGHGRRYSKQPPGSYLEPLATQTYFVINWSILFINGLKYESSFRLNLLLA